MEFEILARERKSAFREAVISGLCLFGATLANQPDRPEEA